jgi:predicted secreted protein
MQAATFTITLVMVWWLVFLIALPIGVTMSATTKPGHAEGAPDKIYLGRKLLITSLISLIITYFVVKFGIPLMIEHFQKPTLHR